MISYNSESQDSAQNPSLFVDLIFYRGPEISECVRVSSDIRFNIAPDTALSTFRATNREGEPFIHLFEVQDALMELFRLTLRYEPCLIVPIDKLSHKTLCRLLEATRCQKSIIECNDFSSPLPTLHLTDISSPEDITNYRPPFRRGRIMIYDTVRNKDLIQQRSTTRPSLSDRQAPVPGEDQPKATEPAQVFVHSSNDDHDSLIDDALSPEDEHEAEEFSALIKQILNSSTVSQKNTSPSPPLKGRESEPQRRETKPTRRPTRSHSEKPAPEPQSPPISEFTRLFEQSFRSFCQQLSEVMGTRADEAIASAKRKIQAQSPDFRLESLSDETAASVIDLIELISVDAPFLKRSRLRQAALTLVADLYNKQYDLLEKHHAIEKVEQCYYRLKK